MEYDFYMHKSAKMELLYVTQYYHDFLGLPGIKLPVGAVHQG